MADIITVTGTTVTHDETAGLQNSTVSVGIPGDANDNDVAVNTLPTAFSTRLTALGADPTGAIGAAASNGSVITISGSGITDIALTDGTGAPLNGLSSGLFTTDNQEIFLYTDTTNNNIVIGKTASNEIIFAVYLQETGSPVTGAKLWTVQYDSLRHTDAAVPDDADRLDLSQKIFVTANQSQNFSFAGAPSGSNLFMIFGDPTGTQIVVIGHNPLNQSDGGNITTKDVLNISQAGGTTSFGVNGNQINPGSGSNAGEGAFITYVTGTNTNFLVPNLDQNEADVEANIAFQDVFNATSASFTVNQTNPGKGPVSVKISAFTTAAETGVNFVDGLTNDSHVNITAFSLTDFVVSGQASTPSAEIDADGNLIIKGLTTGDKVTWTTTATHNRVLIENISNTDGVSGNDNNTFDIGGFSLTQAQPAPDEKLDFTVQIADADGDTASDSFSIGIDGTGIHNDNQVVGVDA